MFPYINAASSMKAANYERVVHTAVRNATVLDHNISPCEESFIPNVSVRWNFLLPIEWFEFISNFCFLHFWKGETFVLYMKMEHARDTVTWLQIAKVGYTITIDLFTLYISAGNWRFSNCQNENKCFKIWDLDARGSHKGLWRFFLKNNSIMVVGFPFSPYSWVFGALCPASLERCFDWHLKLLQEIQTDSGDPNRITSGIDNSEE